jgi:cytochrome c-type biogenesis protein CcmH
MVEGMVASVEAKLRANPGDLDRWEMLMRSRMTLNEPDKAAAALKAAIAANPAARARLEATAALLGIPAA